MHKCVHHGPYTSIAKCEFALRLLITFPGTEILTCILQMKKLWLREAKKFSKLGINSDKAGINWSWDFKSCTSWLLIC